MTVLGFQALAQTRTESGKTIVDSSVELDRVVYDFGDVMLSDGPLKCGFNVKNISDKPMAIYNVVSSCGCTGVKWTREPIAAGGSGKIEAVYSNDEGAYPFDKTLTVYFSSVKKPVILHLRGSVHEKKQPLSELFPVHFGPVAVKESIIKAGNMNQGSQRSDSFKLANISSKPVTVSFSGVSPHLSLSVSPSEIPAGETANVTFTVTADRSLWGKNYYDATLNVGGKPVSAMENGKKTSTLKFWSFTKEDFSSWTKAQKDQASQPSFEESTYNFGKIKSGTAIDAVFSMKNLGKSPLKVYKLDADSPYAVLPEIADVAAGGKSSFHVRVDSSKLPKGECLIVLSLVTNSPLRPLVNLFISGAVI